MSQVAIKNVVQKVVREVANQWVDFKEPVSITMLSSRISGALIRYMGAGWDATRFCRQLETQKLLKLIRTRSGKHWVFLWDVWDQMPDDARIEWSKRLVFMSDAVEEKMNYKKSLRQPK